MKARLVEPQDWPHQVKFMPPITAAGHFVRIGIAIGDECILAAELKHCALDRVRGRFHDRASGRNAADERDHGDVRMARQSLSGLSSPRDDVERACWEQSANQFGEPQRGEGCLFRWLHNDCIAGGERGRRFSGAEHEWMIERDDAADDAQRFADGEIDHVRAHRNRRALHLGDKSREKLHLRGRDHGVADHFLDRIAAVGGIDHGKFVGVLTQDFRDTPQDFGALERQRAPPLRERRFSSRDGGIDILGAGVGDLAKRLSRAGADRIDKAAGFGFVPRAAVVGAAIFRQLDGLG